MLQDSTFRKTAKCSYYKNLLATKDIPAFPIQRVSADSLDTEGLIHETGFNKPFVITNSTTSSSSSYKFDSGKLGLVLPDRDKDLLYISDIVGTNHPVKIMEVGQQTEIIDRTLGEYANYLKHYRPEDHKILNMITLEFSGTPLNSKVQSPTFVRGLDWIDTIWPIGRRARGDYPKVQKYCLAGMAGSYTDFHIDFGGTSVWYHVLTGRKRFYLVPPTTSNLRAFEKWTTSSAQGDQFFGDLLDPPGQCYQFELNPGETFIIPSGWIHAVYTPLDSLVFGGNFVHTYSIVRQLQIYSIEHRTRVQKAYRFPFFRQINWYFLCTVLQPAEEMYFENAQVFPGDDSDDDADDLQMISATFKDPTVLYQLPYLVKTCEIWYASGEDRQEKGVFTSDLKESGCATVPQVFEKWWELLERIGATLPKDIMASTESSEEKSEPTVTAPTTATTISSGASMGTAEHALVHIHNIKAMKQLDLLDDNIVRPVFHTFDAELAKVLPLPPAPRTVALSSCSHHTSTPAITSALGTSTGSEKSDTLVSNSANSCSPQEKPLMLKLSLKLAPKVASSSVKILQEDSSGVDATPTVSTSNAPATSTAGSTTVSTAVADQDSKAVVPVVRRGSLKLTLGHKKPKIFTNTNVEKCSESRPGRYGTRGVKLSAAFLSGAMDIDLSTGTGAASGRGEFGAYSDDEENESNVSDAAADAHDNDYDDHEEEEEEEEHIHREEGVGVASRGKRQKRTNKDNRDSGYNNDFLFRDTDPGASRDEDWKQSSDFQHIELGDHDMDSDATEILSDAELMDSDRMKRKETAQTGKKRRVSAQTIAPLPKLYHVDRVGEYNLFGAMGPSTTVATSMHSAAGGGAAETNVPQVRGVHSVLNKGNKGEGNRNIISNRSNSSGGKSHPRIPMNNRMKIMKKLGMK